MLELVKFFILNKLCSMAAFFSIDLSPYPLTLKGYQVFDVLIDFHDVLVMYLLLLFVCFIVYFFYEIVNICVIVFYFLVVCAINIFFDGNSIYSSLFYFQWRKNFLYFRQMFRVYRDFDCFYSFTLYKSLKPSDFKIYVLLERLQTIIICFTLIAILIPSLFLFFMLDPHAPAGAGMGEVSPVSAGIASQLASIADLQSRGAITNHSADVLISYVKSNVDVQGEIKYAYLSHTADLLDANRIEEAKAVADFSGYADAQRIVEVKQKASQLVEIYNLKTRKAISDESVHTLCNYIHSNVDPAPELNFASRYHNVHRIEEEAAAEVAAAKAAAAEAVAEVAAAKAAAAEAVAAAKAAKAAAVAAAYDSLVPTYVKNLVVNGSQAKISDLVSIKLSKVMTSFVKSSISSTPDGSPVIYLTIAPVFHGNIPYAYAPRLSTMLSNEFWAVISQDINDHSAPVISLTIAPIVANVDSSFISLPIFERISDLIISKCNKGVTGEFANHFSNITVSPVIDIDHIASMNLGSIYQTLVGKVNSVLEPLLNNAARQGINPVVVVTYSPVVVTAS